MSEDYRDDVEDCDREMRRYFAWARAQARRDAWFRWLAMLGLLSFNGGFILWNLRQLRQAWAWIFVLGVIVHSVTAGYLLWKLWHLCEPPDTEETR